jgi:hypothetical protein
LVRKPKEKEGLGVINLSIQNDALLLKQLDKFYRKENIQWVALIWQKYYNNTVPHLAREKGSFWWKDILRLHTQYRVLPFVTRIKRIPSVSGMISLMASFTLRSSPIFCIFPKILPFPCSPLEMLIIYWIVSEFLCPELHTMSSLIYRTL